MGMHLIMMVVMLLYAQLADMHFVQYVLLMLEMEVIQIFMGIMILSRVEATSPVIPS